MPLRGLEFHIVNTDNIYNILDGVIEKDLSKSNAPLSI